MTPLERSKEWIIQWSDDRDTDQMPESLAAAFAAVAAEARAQAIGECVAACEARGASREAQHAHLAQEFGEQARNAEWVYCKGTEARACADDLRALLNGGGK